MWESDLERSICSVDQLLDYVSLSQEEERKLRAVAEKHPIRIPKYYLDLIHWDNPLDPIRLLAVPSVHELDLAGSYDTSGEKDSTKLAGLQHKYAETALLLSNHRCAMYCRHCFRKRLVGLSENEVVENFENAFEYIQEHDEINNVLITGGDPFVLSTDILEHFLQRLSNIGHLRFIRFGTRVPVTFPQRILEDERLVAVLGKYSVPHRRVYVVTHFNHPREITPESTMAADKLLKAGVIMNNQTVLLRNVNDDPHVLANLQSSLVGIGINPYYVFQCRPVKRVKTHFQVPLQEGYNIVEDAKSMLDGHSKRFKYIMSHRRGKIEIVGINDGEIYFKQHQAKNPREAGSFFKRKLDSTAGWLDDFPPWRPKNASTPQENEGAIYHESSPVLQQQ